MLRFFLIFFLSILSSYSNAEIKDKIIQNLKNTNNLDFKFEQNINGKIENGNCTIEYPKKIFCEYARSNNKVLVSNGKSLVIKTRTSYYRYPLETEFMNIHGGRSWPSWVPPAGIDQYHNKLVNSGSEEPGV